MSLMLSRRGSSARRVEGAPDIVLPMAVACYSMDGSLGAISGSIPDESGNGRHLTGTLGSRIAGQSGQAFRPGNYPEGEGAIVARVSDPTLYDTDTLTIMGWVSPWLTQDGERFLFGFCSGDGGGSTFCIWQRRSVWNPGDFLLGTYRTGGLNPLRDDDVTLPVGSWSHVAMTYDQAFGARLFLNAQEVDASPNTSGLTSAQFFYVGHYGYGTSTADFDDVRIYHAALTPEQIQAAMDGQV